MFHDNERRKFRLKVIAASKDIDKYITTTYVACALCDTIANGVEEHVISEAHLTWESNGGSRSRITEPDTEPDDETSDQAEAVPMNVSASEDEKEKDPQKEKGGDADEDRKSQVSADDIKSHENKTRMAMKNQHILPSQRPSLTMLPSIKREVDDAMYRRARGRQDFVEYRAEREWEWQEQGPVHIPLHTGATQLRVSADGLLQVEPPIMCEFAPRDLWARKIAQHIPHSRSPVEAKAFNVHDSNEMEGAKYRFGGNGSGTRGRGSATVCTNGTFAITSESKHEKMMVPPRPSASRLCMEANSVSLSLWPT